MAEVALALRVEGVGVLPDLIQVPAETLEIGQLRYGDPGVPEMTDGVRDPPARITAVHQRAVEVENDAVDRLGQFLDHHGDSLGSAPCRPAALNAATMWLLPSV
jgi:hypothetical protein